MIREHASSHHIKDALTVEALSIIDVFTTTHFRKCHLDFSVLEVTFQVQVTGGSGYVGSHILIELLRKGYRVRA